MNIAAWLMALVGPLAIRVIIALGFTAVTLTGVTAAVASLVSIAQNSWSAMPVGVLQLASLSGIPQGLATIFSAYMALFGLRAASGFKKYILK